MIYRGADCVVYVREKIHMLHILHTLVYRGYLSVVNLNSRMLLLSQEASVPKREKSKRLQVVISEEQDSLLTKTAYQLSNPERLVSKSEVVRLGISMLNQALERGELDPEVLKILNDAAANDNDDTTDTPDND